MKNKCFIEIIIRISKRCGHATGEDEDYIQFAIENGYEELGFSDHISHTNFQQNEEYIKK